jgi:hypothetical protein
MEDPYIETASRLVQKNEIALFWKDCPGRRCCVVSIRRGRLMEVKGQNHPD